MIRKTLMVFGLILVFGSISTLLFILLYFAFTKETKINFSSNYTSLVFIVLFLMTVFGYVIGFYLEKGFDTFGKIKQRDINGNKGLKVKIDSIEEKLKTIEKENLPKEAIDNFIKNILENEATSIVEEKIKKDFKEELIKERSYELIENELSELEKNISLYIDKLSRGGSINLVIGVLTTMIAIIGLSVFMFESQIDFENTNKLLSHYIPRLSIVIFIEIFSFFFLKLYRNNLEDVKYFENERTNINSKKAALKFAYLTENKEVINEILLDLSKTERNFKLAKDETTVTLEKIKLENTQSSTNFQTLMSLFKLKDKE